MQKYVRGIHEDTGLCDNVALGTDTEYYIKEGFELRDVELAYDDRWYLVGKVPTKPISSQDYNDAAEEYLRNVRCERGYTKREPSPTYDDSPNARWKSDAADWKVFFNKVMEYNIEVQNKVDAEDPDAPTLEEFKEHLKTIKCEWTYQV